MSDRYIPKVGDEGFEWRPEFYDIWFKRGKVIAETDKQIVFLKTNGEIGTVSKKCSFRPIPTKADVEREQMVRAMRDNSTNEDAALELYELGFTIPKQVKPVDIENAILDKVAMSSLDAHNATSALRELFSDFIEED